MSKVTRLSALLLLLPLASAALCQTPTAPPPTPPATPPPAQVEPPAARPIPDINELMKAVEAHQHQAEDLERSYIYKMSNKLEELDGKGAVKKTETRDMEVFWLQGVRVTRTLRKDGKDLTPDEKKKEDERIDKEVVKVKEKQMKSEGEGRATDSAGHDEISFARILELGTFSNARRELIAGRPTIAIDFAGDPKAKTHNTGEAVLHELSGTVWVDEQDKSIQHLEGHFANNFKLGGGLLVNVRAGTWFRMTAIRINNELWLPEFIEGHGHVRYFLFFTLDGNFSSRTSDYRKFKTSSVIVPNANPTVVPPDPETKGPGAP